MPATTIDRTFDVPAVTVRVRPSPLAHWLMWTMAGLVALPFILVLIASVSSPNALRNEPAALPSFGIAALLAVLLARRLLRPITLVLDERNDALTISMPRFLQGHRSVVRSLHDLVALETVQSGEVRQVVYNTSSPMWTLVVRLRDGQDVELWRNLLATTKPWTDACHEVNAWCHRREAQQRASASPVSG